MKATYLVVIPIILKFDSNIGFLTIIKKICYKYFFFLDMTLFVISV